MTMIESHIMRAPDAGGGSAASPPPLTAGTADRELPHWMTQRSPDTAEALDGYLCEADAARAAIGEPKVFSHWYDLARGAALDAALAGKPTLADERMSTFLSELSQKSQALTLVLERPSNAAREAPLVTISEWGRMMHGLWRLPIAAKHQRQILDIWIRPFGTIDRQKSPFAYQLATLHKTVITDRRNPELDTLFTSTWSTWVNEVYTRKNFKAIEYLFDINRLAGIAGDKSIERPIATSVMQMLSLSNMNPDAAQYVLRTTRRMREAPQDRVIAYARQAFEWTISETVRAEAVKTLAYKGEWDDALRRAEQIRDYDAYHVAMRGLLRQAIYTGQPSLQTAIVASMRARDTTVPNPYDLTGETVSYITRPEFPRDGTMDLTAAINAVGHAITGVERAPFALFRIARAIWSSQLQQGTTAARLLLGKYLQSPILAPEEPQRSWDRLHIARANLYRHTKQSKPVGWYRPLA